MPDHQPRPAAPGNGLAVILLIGLAFIAFMVWMGNARAADQPDMKFVCLPLDVVEAQATALGSRPGVKIERFVGESAATLLRVLNAEEPATDWAANLVILARYPNGVGTLALVNGEQGCMATFLIGAEVLKRAVDAVGAAA